MRVEIRERSFRQRSEQVQDEEVSVRAALSNKKRHFVRRQSLRVLRVSRN
jgi:hypothetical protein